MELLTRAKAEFVTQAIETLHKEVQNKNIDIKGYTMAPPETSNEAEREEVVLNKITEEYGRIRETYDSYASEKESMGDGMDSAMIERMESLRKFLLSLEKISILMHYGRACDEWMHDVAMEVRTENPAEILSKTMPVDKIRGEIVDFILNNREMAKNEIFTKAEVQIFKDSRIIPYKGQ